MITKVVIYLLMFIYLILWWQWTKSWCRGKFNAI